MVDFSNRFNNDLLMYFDTEYTSLNEKIEKQQPEYIKPVTDKAESVKITFENMFIELGGHIGRIQEALDNPSKLAEAGSSLENMKTLLNQSTFLTPQEKEAFFNQPVFTALEPTSEQVINAVNSYIDVLHQGVSNAFKDLTSDVLSVSAENETFSFRDIPTNGTESPNKVEDGVAYVNAAAKNLEKAMVNAETSTIKQFSLTDRIFDAGNGVDTLDLSGDRVELSNEKVIEQQASFGGVIADLRELDGLPGHLSSALGTFTKIDIGNFENVIGTRRFDFKIDANGDGKTDFSVTMGGNDKIYGSTKGSVIKPLSGNDEIFVNMGKNTIDFAESAKNDVKIVRLDHYRTDNDVDGENTLIFDIAKNEEGKFGLNGTHIIYNFEQKIAPNGEKVSIERILQPLSKDSAEGMVGDQIQVRQTEEDDLSFYKDIKITKEGADSVITFEGGGKIILKDFDLKVEVKPSGYGQETFNIPVQSSTSMQTIEVSTPSGDFYDPNSDSQDPLPELHLEGRNLRDIPSDEVSANLEENLINSNSIFNLQTPGVRDMRSMPSVGNNYIIGGDGDDELKGDDRDGSIFGGKGNDKLKSGDGNDNLNGGFGNDKLYVNGDGQKNLIFELTQVDGKYQLGDGTSDGDKDTVKGLDKKNIEDVKFFFVNANGDNIQLSEEDFKIEKDGSDVVIRFEGGGKLVLEDVSDKDVPKVHSLIKREEFDPTNLTGTESKDKIKGSDLDETIHGKDGDDKLEGKDGDDILYGGKGDDKLKGGDGNDTLYGGEDDDELKGGDGNDQLFGESGNDKLKGGDGDDLLVSGDGKDKLEGGAGNDTLDIAGTGAKTLVFEVTKVDGVYQLGNGKEGAEHDTVKNMVDPTEVTFVFNDITKGSDSKKEVNLKEGDDYTIEYDGVDTHINFAGGGQITIEQVGLTPENVKSIVSDH